MISKIIALAMLIFFSPVLTYAKTEAPSDVMMRFEVDAAINRQDNESRIIDAVYKATKATVQIQVDNFLSAGFFIAPDKILTCWHILDTDGPGKMRVEHNADSIQVDVAKVDKERDLALIQLRRYKEYSKDYLPIAKDTQIGQTALTTGYPQGYFLTSKGIVSQFNRNLVTSVDMNKPLGQQSTFHSFTTINIQFVPGNSGGAVYNIDGEVIGVASKEEDQFAGFGYATSLEDIKAFLNEG